MKLKTCKLESIKELHEIINEEISKNKKSKLIFRGESSSKYELLPSALRKNGLEYYHGLKPRIEPIQEYEQVAAELNILQKLAKAIQGKSSRADIELSFILKNQDMEERREQLKSFLHSNYKNWISPILWDIVAFGQHHGIPTRALDWTSSIDTASFFTSSGALPKVIKSLELGQQPDDEMVIWMLNTAKLDSKLPLEIVDARDTNKNAEAQDSVLTCWVKKAPFNGPVDLRTFDKVLEDYKMSDALTKLTFPAVKSGEMLQDIYVKDLHEGRNTARTLFPGEYGKVKYANDLINIEKFESLTK